MSHTDNIDNTASDERSSESSRRLYRTRPIQRRVLFFLITTIFVLGAAVIAVGGLLYASTNDDQYERVGGTLTSMMTALVTTDDLSRYAQSSDPDDTYREDYSELHELLALTPQVRSLFFFTVVNGEKRVIFDVRDDKDTESGLGDIEPFRTQDAGSLKRFKAGDEVGPVLTPSDDGHVFIVFSPIYDADGSFVAYAAVDFYAEAIIGQRISFIVRIGIIVLTLGALAVFIAHRIVRRKLVEPIDDLTEATDRFAYDSPEARHRSLQHLREIQVTTGDEVEALYNAVVKSTEDATEYFDQLRAKIDTITRMQDNIIEGFASLVESRDTNTGGHIRRTSSYVEIIATRMREDGMFPDVITDDYVKEIVKAAPLHDVGKIKVSDTILNKPGKLDDDEFATMKKHSAWGAEILNDTLEGITDTAYLSTALQMARYHHERYDGKGYPDGLRGEEIPLCARIMAVSDVFDALVSNRSYKKGFPLDKAFAIVEEGAGTQFDATVVKAFLEEREKISEIALRYNAEEDERR